ncbi:MAG: hypothetical protein AAFP07_04775 [Cyanobacteria bacterium J06606_4]
MSKPSRIFLDTNIYIVGAADSQSDESLILEWIGYWKDTPRNAEVVISQELLEQISRVAKRLRNKDWGGEIIGQIWNNLDIHYVSIDAGAFEKLEAESIIPREDIGVYLTAKAGIADCFVSANHKLIRSLVQDTKEFECLTPAIFFRKYIS